MIFDTIRLLGKSEIIAQLPHLTPDERAEVRAKLDELAGDPWQDRGELSDSDKQALEATVTSYEVSPDAGGSWDDVKARVQARLRS